MYVAFVVGREALSMLCLVRIVVTAVDDGFHGLVDRVDGLWLGL